MIAKDFLLQIKKIDTLISNKLVEYQQWRDLALSITANMGGEKVQSTSSQQKMSDAIDNCVDIEMQIDRFVEELAEKKRIVIEVIEQLPEPEYDVLHKVYVQYKTFYEVADERDISHSWATALHGRALKLLENILKEREKVD